MHGNQKSLTRRQLLTGGAALGGIAVVGAPALMLGRAAIAQESVAAFDGLRKAMRGDLITPADGAYDAARRLWNGMIDRRPAAVARCTGVADVISVVKFSRDNDWPVSVRGGGHNVAGKAVRDDAITIDLSPMRGVRVDPKARTGRAEGGVLWGEFDTDTIAFGLGTTGGTVSTTGLAGLTLGGGLGWLMRKHGLSCDNLLSADVVTADGRLLTASRSENKDLFWAIRGGGGNFGVVTSFEFRLHELQSVVGGIAMYPQTMNRDLLEFFRDYTATAPDSVTTMAGVAPGAPGTPLEGQSAGWIAVCHCGSQRDGERLVQPIKDFGPPAMDFVGPTTYKAQQTMFDGGAVPGQRQYWSSNFALDLGDEVIDTCVAAAEDLHGEGTMLLIEHMGGAVARVGEHETAFSHRSAQYNVSVLSSWTDAADDEANVAWTRATSGSIREFSTGGGYVNYTSDVQSGNHLRGIYETNLERLTEVKRKYDPANFFSSNHNIKP